MKGSNRKFFNVYSRIGGRKMENVVVFGLGQDYEQFKGIINHKYKVVGYSDNHICIGSDLFVKPADIHKIVYDKILICTKKYFYSIKIQLVDEIGVSVDKIIGLDDLMNDETDLSNKRFKKVIADLKLYNKLNHKKNFTINECALRLIDSDADDTAGKPCVHYFAQDIWGAKKILQNCPREHYDIGSRLDGFIAHLLVFRKVNYIDVRPLPYDIPNLNFIQGDATNLKELEDDSVESLSSFHAIEHFGLGRYGDPINPEASFQAMRSMVRVVRKGGRIYLGVPIGSEDRLIFNSDRIFRVKTVLDNFVGTKLVDAQIIRGANTYTEDLIKKDWDRIENFSCGLFEFIKQ